MNNQLIHKGMSITLIVLGLWFAISYKRHARYTIEFWRNILKKEYNESLLQLLFLFGGITSTVVGLLALIGVIKYKN